MGIGVLVIGSFLLATWTIYIVLIGFFTYGWFRPETSLKIKNTDPGMKVSIIIAARNEERYIIDLLGDLFIQDYPSGLMEIIVVDDHSTDNTVRIIKDFVARNSFNNFTIIISDDKSESGKKAAITQGVNRSGADLILTTDADCRVGPGWVSSLAAHFQDENIRMVFGPVMYFDKGGLASRFQSLEFSGLMASGAGAAGAGLPFMCSGACLAYRKTAFLQVSGFKGNEKFISGDDVFLLHKMKKTFGRKAIIFCKNKDALVKTYPVHGFMMFLNQRARWASKSKGYKDALSVITAIIIFSYSFSLLLSFIAGFFNSIFFFVTGGLLFIKIITDLSLMLGITAFTGQRGLMRWYLPFQLVYPFYIVVAGMLSLFERRKW